MIEQTNDFNLPSSEADRKAIKLVLDEISNAFARAEAEREFVKEEIEALSEKFEIPKKYLNKLARIYHKQNIKAVTSDAETLVAMYESITGKSVDD